MVLKPHDIEHLSVMAELASRPEKLPDLKTFLPTTNTSSFANKLTFLCSGLREKGFTTYANDLEERFVMLKKAEVHLYNVHDETGEQVVNQAHPEGDHNVSDGELGDVETIVSQFNKVRKVVEKQPTGKLGSIVQQCKLVLAETPKAETPNQQQLTAKIEETRADAFYWASQLEDVVDNQANLNWTASGASPEDFGGYILKAVVPAYGMLPGTKPVYMYYMHYLKSNLEDKDIKLPQIKNAQDCIKKLEYVLKPVLNIQGAPKDVWEFIKPKIDTIKDDLNEMIEDVMQLGLLGNPATTPSGGTTPSPTSSAPIVPLHSAKKQLLTDLQNIKTQWASSPRANEQDDKDWFVAQEKDNRTAANQQDIENAKINMAKFAKDRHLTYEPTK